MKTFYLGSPCIKGEKQRNHRGQKRFLTLLLMCLMTVVGWAQSVTFDFVVNDKKDRFDTKTIDGITVLFSESQGDNGYHVLETGTLKITSENKSITGVEIFIGRSSYSSIGSFNSSTKQLTAGKVILEATNFTSNDITVTANGKVQITKIIVYSNTTPIPVTECKISLSETNVGVNKDFTLTAVANGNPTPTYQWYENDTEIPDETNSSYTTSKSSTGTYTYYCIAKNNTGEENDNVVKSETATVIVVKNDITLSSSDMNMSIGDATKPIEVTAKDGEEVINGLAYTYESDNTGVATVDESGNVTPVAVGEATITVSFAGNETYNGATTTLRVAVTAAPVVAEPIFILKEVKEDAGSEAEVDIDIDALKDKAYEGERLRLYFKLPEGLVDATNCVVRYTMVNDENNSGTSTPTTEYKGGYILLTSTTFVTAVVYNTKTKKEVGERITKTIRFNFTLINDLKEGVQLNGGDQRIIATEDGSRKYVIATYGSKGEANVWEKTSVDGTMGSSEISGFKYVARGQQDAKGESKKQFDGSTQYVPYTEVTNGYYTEASTDNGTFKIPVSGAYIKFEPKMGGTINVILRQNGIIANADNPNHAVMRTRPIYVCDEEGRVVENVRAFINANSDMNVEIFKFGATDNSFTEDTGENPQTVEQSERNFKLYRNLVYRAGHMDCTLSDDGLTLTDASGNTVSDDDTKAYWRGDAKTEVDHNILYKDGNGWITLSKAYVRYSFDVKPGKTYFIMGHVTKVGACGYSFKRLIKDDTKWAEIVNNRNITINEDGTGEELVEGLPASIEAHKTGISGCNVTLNRTFDAGVWTSLVLPFSVSPSTLEDAFGQGTQILHFGKVDGSKLNLVKHFHQMIVAGTPVQIKPVSKKENPKFENITYTGYVPIKEMTGGNWKITGSYIPKDMPANSYYIGYKADGTGNNIYLSTKVRRMNGTRAWFEYIGEGTFSKLTGLSINGVEDGTTTDIGSILTDAENANVMNGNVYNLNGQIVSRNGIEGLAKGIYVTNGKKIIVK